MFVKRRITLVLRFCSFLSYPLCHEKLEFSEYVYISPANQHLAIVPTSDNIIMAKNCGKCSKAIRGIEFAKCAGFCEQIYHFACCGLSKQIHDTILAHTIWICGECKVVANNRSLKEICSNGDGITAIDDLKQQMNELNGNVQSLSETVSACVNNSKSGFQQFDRQLADTNNKIEMFLDKVGTVEVITDAGSQQQRQPYQKHRADVARRAEQGAADINIDGLTVSRLVPEEPVPLFWLYLSGLHPQVSVEDIQKVVKSCLTVSDAVTVVKLVPKGKDLSRVTFISFKIGLSLDLKDTALLPETWPKGIRFREFEDYSKNRPPSTI